MGDPRTAKPKTMQEYGKLRERMILRPWVCMSEADFIHAVTCEGCPFHGALMNGIDLHEFGSELQCWRMQSIVGLDFDKCEVRGLDMVAHLQKKGLKPWLGYYTFSCSTSLLEPQSYRILWRVENDLNLQYSQVATAIKVLNKSALLLGDKHALNPTRLWQGSNSGFFYWAESAAHLNVKQVLAEVGSSETPQGVQKRSQTAVKAKGRAVSGEPCMIA